MREQQYMYFLFGHVSKQHDARLLPSHWLILKEKVDKYPEVITVKVWLKQILMA